MAKKAKPIANRPLPDEKIGGEDADLLRIARERRQKAYDFDEDNREKAVEDLEFLSGDQWPNEIINQRQEDSRPSLTINRMPQFVRQVTGDIRENRPAVKVRPGDSAATDDLATVLTGTIRNIEYNSDANIAYETAAEGAAQCGIGHFRIVTEYSSDDAFEQDIRVKTIRDHLSVLWDPHAVEPTKSDARYCFVEESLDIETFKARYPNASTDGWDSAQQSNTHLGDWLTHETVRVAEYWTIEKQERKLALLDDGRAVDVTDFKDFDGVYVDAETGENVTAVKTRQVWRNRVEMRIVNGGEVLEGPFEWPGKWIPVVPVVGEEIYIEGKVIRYGVIRHAKDAQRMYNFWRSAQTEKIALEPKVPWLVTPTMIAGLEEAWSNANTRNLPYLPYTPDEKAPGAKPERNAPQMGSAAMVNEVLTAADDMKATTGIYDASLGARSNETSGIAITKRKQESDISTIAYGGNLSRAIRHAGRILVDLIPKVYDTDRVVRVMNEDETTEAVRINQIVIDDAGVEHRINDLSLGKYDVIVSAGPSYSTKRDAAVEGMVDLVRAMPELGKVIMDILVKNLDWPGADEISERLRKMLPPGIAESDEEPTPEEQQAQDQAAEEQEMQQGLAMEQMKAEFAKLQAEIAKNNASADKLQAETEGQSLENAEKALELAVANGAIQDIVARQVGALLTQMFGQPQAPMPMQPGQPPVTAPLMQPPMNPGV